MKCRPTCKMKIHFISPEMSSLFDHAIINLPNGEEEHHSITPPTKWRVKGSDFSSAPVEAYKPIFTYKSELKDGITVRTAEFKHPEIVYNSRYTGVDKRDKYFRDIKKINKRLMELYPDET